MTLTRVTAGQLIDPAPFRGLCGWLAARTISCPSIRSITRRSASPVPTVCGLPASKSQTDVAACRSASLCCKASVTVFPNQRLDSVSCSQMVRRHRDSKAIRKFYLSSPVTVSVHRDTASLRGRCRAMDFGHGRGQLKVVPSINHCSRSANITHWSRRFLNSRIGWLGYNSHHGNCRDMGQQVIRFRPQDPLLV